MLDSRTHINPSSLGVPLSPLSSHLKWVHWPLGEIRRFARRSTQQKSSSEPETGPSRDLRSSTTTKTGSTKNLEFTKRPGVNFGKVESNCQTTWCVCEHHPVLSRANVQGVIERWSQTLSEAIRHYNIPRIRVAWRIGLKPLVVRLRSKASRVIQNLRNLSCDEVRFSEARIFQFSSSFTAFSYMFFFFSCCVFLVSFPSLSHLLRPARESRTTNFLGFVGDVFVSFSRLRTMYARTWFKISSR